MLGVTDYERIRRKVRIEKNQVGFTTVGPYKGEYWRDNVPRKFVASKISCTTLAKLEVPQRQLKSCQRRLKETGLSREKRSRISIL